MLSTMDEGYKVMQLRGQRLDPLALVLPHDAGQRAGDVASTAASARSSRARRPTIVVLNASATPQMALRMETCGLARAGTVPVADLRRRPGRWSRTT